MCNTYNYNYLFKKHQGTLYYGMNNQISADSITFLGAKIIYVIILY